jgi:hypothetical protein
MANIPIYIPTYINSAEYTPVNVQPRLLFFNGVLNCESYYIESASAFGGISKEQNSFPYFDNYNVVTGSFPTVNSKSLLFFNEEPVYGEMPDESLYSTYWSNYVQLIYNPRTKLLNASAIIPLADYFNIELNDIVEFRSNYYHLRAINDYNLKNGECSIQLLGPILSDSLNLPVNLFPKCLGYDPTDCLVACYSSCECTPPCPPSPFGFTSVDDSSFSFEMFTTASNYLLELPIQRVSGLTSRTPYETLFTASWGDGTQSYISGSESAAASHLYTNSGTYTVTLSGQCEFFGVSQTSGQSFSLRNVLTKINKWGSMQFGAISFNGCDKLTQIPDGEPGLYSLYRILNMFSVGTRTNSPRFEIPQNLFKYCHNLGNRGQDVQAIFASNQYITYIPEKLFYYSPNVYFPNSAFSNCNNLRFLPNQLFPPLPNRSLIEYGAFYNIGNMFRSTDNLQSIPSNMFDPITGSIGSFAQRVFSQNSTINTLTGNAPQLWLSQYSSSTWSVTDFFENCVNLTNYNDIPAGWK